MLNSIIRFSLNNRLLITAATLLLLIAGFFVLRQLPVDVLPDLNRPTVTVFAEAEGLSPGEIETMVSYPIETSMNGALGVERVRSVSAVGLGLVFVEFAWNTDIYIDRQLVNEKLQGLREVLPAGVNPTMGPVSSIMGEIMLISLSGDSTSPMDLRTMADWVVKPALLSVPGVSQVISMGGDLKQYHVHISPDRMRQYGVTLHQIDEALTNTNSNTSGGFLVQNYTESMVRSIGRVESLADVKNTVVAFNDGQGITLDQVATVEYGSPPKRGSAGANAKPAVIISVKKQPGASTIELTAKVDDALKALKKNLPADISINAHIFRQSSFIQSAIRNVFDALRDGSILVVIVLFLFLLNFRTTFITLMSIPLSIIATALIFKAYGLSINTMTLGGIAAAIGVLVDDAIVDVENIFRRLKENKRLAYPVPVADVIFVASSEVRNSILFATIIVVLVFIPLFAMGGIEGRIFTPLGIAYVVSVLASMAVSLTVTPVLCFYLLPNARFMKKDGDSPFVRLLKFINRNYVLRLSLDHPKLTIGTALILLLIAVATVPFMGKEFLPPFNEGSVTINVLSPPGTSLTESERIGVIAEKLILKVPEAISTGRRTGRAEEDDHAEGVHSTEIDVALKASKRSREVVLHNIRDNLEQIPGIAVNIGQPISHRIDHLLSGVRAQIAIKLFGTDLTILRQKAAEIEGVVSSIHGVVDLSVEKQVLVPQTVIKLNRDQLKVYGLQSGEVANLIQAALNGKMTSDVLEDQKRFALVLLLEEGSRNSIEKIGQLLVDLPNGEQIPLSMLATIEQSMGPNQILHENAQRRIVIQCNTSGRDLGTVIGDIRKEIDRKVHLPSGYTVQYGGQFESQQAATRSIAILGLLSLAGIFLVLFVYLRSTNLAGLVLFNIPFSMIGAVAAIWLTNRTFSIGSLVGFVALCGITSRNGILLVSHYLHLLRKEGETWNRAMIIKGASERLVPVLMTALTAALALVPLILTPGEPGKEIIYSVALVIFGGLISSTIMNIALVPTLFWNFSRNAVETVLSSDTAKGGVSK